MSTTRLASSSGIGGGGDTSVVVVGPWSGLENSGFTTAAADAGTAAHHVVECGLFLVAFGWVFAGGTGVFFDPTQTMGPAVEHRWTIISFGCFVAAWWDVFIVTNLSCRLGITSIFGCGLDA